MTREEVIKELEKMKKFNYALAPLEVYDMAIKALWAVEHMPTTKNDLEVLDKIRADVQNGIHHFLDGEPIIEIKEVLQIIDKYKVKSKE